MIKNTSESGRSMVEMLGVIAIIGVIAIGGITSMAYLDAYFRTTATLAEIDQMASDLIDLCSWSTIDGYESCLKDDVNQLLCEEKVLDCIDGKAKNRWGGDITIAAQGPDNFSITFTEIPASICEQLNEELKNASPRHIVELYSCGEDSEGNAKAVFRLPPY